MYKTQAKRPICIKHMDKHTATRTYDTHVNSMKDGKNSTLNKSPVTCFKLYPSVSNVGFFNSDGIQKKQQKISFLKQSKRGKKITCSTYSKVKKKSLRVAWQSEPKNLL